MKDEKQVQVLFRVPKSKKSKIKSLAAANGQTLQKLYEAFTNAYITGKVIVSDTGHVTEVK